MVLFPKPFLFKPSYSKVALYTPENITFPDLVLTFQGWNGPLEQDIFLYFISKVLVVSDL